MDKTLVGKAAVHFWEEKAALGPICLDYTAMDVGGGGGVTCSLDPVFQLENY